MNSDDIVTILLKNYYEPISLDTQLNIRNISKAIPLIRNRDSFLLYDNVMINTMIQLEL